MSDAMLPALGQNFLGQAPNWYKRTIVAFLLLNPYITGWVLVLEFIFTLAMALKCYPLLPGGLLAMEALLIGMTSPEALYKEVLTNFPVILLLMFMVAGIYFMKDLLLLTFTKLILGVRSKSLLGLMFSLVAAVLSAFLDALTVTAVIISVAVGFYGVYHKVASAGAGTDSQDGTPVEDPLHREHLAQPADAWRCRHRPGWCLHTRWRTTESADCRGRWLGLH